MVLLVAGVPARAQPRSGAAPSDTVVPISAELCADMKRHHVLNPGAPVTCERLRLVRFRYVDFDGASRDDGEVVVMDAAADHVLQVFIALHSRTFPIASAKLMNAFEGDDDASMDHNNTSAFNVRPVPGSRSISLHAYALAIDLNPLQNPYLRRAGGGVVVSPKAGTAYLRRRPIRPGMAEPIVDIFANEGFTIWGGRWQQSTDYQHFQVGRPFAQRLARASSVDAQAMFERHVQRYRECVRRFIGGAKPKPGACAD
jgi:hypothetical protein